MNIDISEVITRMEKDFNRLESENARLRKALREIADSDSISRYRLIEMAEKALDRPESEAKAPNVTAQELVDDVDIPKTGYVQNSKPLQYPPDLENRQLQADNARLREALRDVDNIANTTAIDRLRFAIHDAVRKVLKGDVEK